MFRFIFRTLGVLFLALAVLFAVIDATKSLGVSTMVLTPLQVSWEQFLPQSFADSTAWLSENAPNFVNDPILVNVLTWPTFIICAGLAALFYFCGYKRSRPEFFTKR